MTFGTSKRRWECIESLKDVRLNKGISISHISRATGLSRERIYNIEAGKSDVPGVKIQDFAEAYGLDLISFIKVHRGDMENARMQESKKYWRYWILRANQKRDH